MFCIAINAASDRGFPRAIATVELPMSGENAARSMFELFKGKFPESEGYSLCLTNHNPQVDIVATSDNW